MAAVILYGNMIPEDGSKRHGNYILLEKQSGQIAQGIKIYFIIIPFNENYFNYNRRNFEITHNSNIQKWRYIFSDRTQLAKYMDGMGFGLVFTDCKTMVSQGCRFIHLLQLGIFPPVPFIN